ncbi:class I SAM-dependent methyltransferase [Mangrovicoccus sp. HB161399]|uniref:class I SAM-dependent methyltransferase n=1 Tax=Mangrovicoccus sp. HB161399 TaxID=2720392 RepID=UPI001555B496
MTTTLAPSDRTVRDFYDLLPYNHFDDPATAIARARANPLSAYPDLDATLAEAGPGLSAVEIGCGTGWASNALALHYGARAEGVDFSATALERARRVAEATDSGARFVQSDLFAYRPATPPALTLSIGVLHHTHDCRAAFDHVAGFVPSGGLFFLGLYHAPGRLPFLRHWRGLLEREGEAAALAAFGRAMPQSPDPEHLASVFRDQVLHPQESQHKLQEVWGWMEAAGLRLISTSINRYGPVAEPEELFAEEAAYAALSEERIAEGRYFPGFFTMLMERP